MFLLDTNVVSDLRRARTGRGDPKVARWAEAQEPSSLFLSVMTLFEVEVGIRRLGRRDPVQAAALRSWMTGHLETAFAGRILNIDDRISILAASFHAPDPAPFADSFIAATALAWDATLVTADRKLLAWQAPVVRIDARR